MIDRIVSNDQVAVHQSFIDAEVKAERDRRAALDARGQALVTSSGVLVTLLQIMNGQR